MRRRDLWDGERPAGVDEGRVRQRHATGLGDSDVGGVDGGPLLPVAVVGLRDAPQTVPGDDGAGDGCRGSGNLGIGQLRYRRRCRCRTIRNGELPTGIDPVGGIQCAPVWLQDPDVGVIDGVPLLAISIVGFSDVPQAVSGDDGVGGSCGVGGRQDHARGRGYINHSSDGRHRGDSVGCGRPSDGCKDNHGGDQCCHRRSSSGSAPCPTAAAPDDIDRGSEEREHEVPPGQPCDHRERLGPKCVGDL